LSLLMGLLCKACLHGALRLIHHVGGVRERLALAEKEKARACLCRTAQLVCHDRPPPWGVIAPCSSLAPSKLRDRGYSLRSCVIAATACAAVAAAAAARTSSAASAGVHSCSRRAGLVRVLHAPCIAGASL
jgi:hypothetical protein